MSRDTRHLEPPDPTDHEMSPAYKPQKDHAVCAGCGYVMHISSLHKVEGLWWLCHTCWLDDGL